MKNKLCILLICSHFFQQSNCSISFEYAWQPEDNFGVPFWYYQGYNWPYEYDWPYDWVYSNW